VKAASEAALSRSATGSAPHAFRRFKVAHVTATFPPYLAGTGNVAFHNADSLARLGHSVEVYTAATGAARRSEGRVVRRLRPLLRFGNAPLLPGLIAIRGVDLVHLHYPFIFGGEMISVVSAMSRVPYVLTYHNDLLASGAKGIAFRAYERIWGRRILNGARRVFVPSLDAVGASNLLTALARRAPERIHELPNGVDTTVFTEGADGASIRDRLKIEHDRPVLIFVGQMDTAHHGKGGVPQLLHALASVRPPTTVLILVGGGDRAPEYQALASRLDLRDRTYFVGPVENRELPAFFAAADVAVQPSVNRELFGMVALEAMACGLPVITSDLPGARRVVTQAGGGLLTRPGDVPELARTIERLVTDASLRQRLGAAGRAAVHARYDWQHIAHQLEQAYAEVLAR
jgi:glycosyltransferase involved in cell wall biosynthesis